jgi:hypothetical protein
MSVRTLVLLLALALLPSLAGAQPEQALALVPLPAEKLRALAPLLRTRDLVLVESTPDGALRQLTVMTLVAAPPELVRDVVLQVERYPEFVRNLRSSHVEVNRDGSFDHTYALSYTLFTIDGRNRYVRLPPDGYSDAPPVEAFDPDGVPRPNHRLRFEFYRAGGGTVLVAYGYTNLRHSFELVTKMLHRMPSLEHGLALIPQLTFTLSMRARAEQLVGSYGVVLPAAGTASYDFLLPRGVVGLFRSRGERLYEMTLIDQSRASSEAVREAAEKSEAWSKFIPIITESREIEPVDDVKTVSLKLSLPLPLLSFTTRYGVRVSPSSVDMLGFEGDLRGSRWRFDVSELPAPFGAAPGQNFSSGKARTQVVLRAQQSLDRANLLLRKLYQLEPLFEYGINLGLQFLLLRSVEAYAEH